MSLAKGSDRRSIVNRRPSKKEAQKTTSGSSRATVRMETLQDNRVGPGRVCLVFSSTDNTMLELIDKRDGASNYETID